MLSQHVPAVTKTINSIFCILLILDDRDMSVYNGRGNRTKWGNPTKLGMSLFRCFS